METPLWPGYPISPGDIDPSYGFNSPPFGGRLGKAAEIAISFIQERDQGWAPFTDDDIQQYYRRKTGRTKRFKFRKVLFSQGYLIIKRGQISVTHELAATCFLYWPARNHEAPQERTSSS